MFPPPFQLCGRQQRRDNTEQFGILRTVLQKAILMDRPTEAVTRHYPIGCWRQEGNFWALICECGEPFEAPTKEEARTAWAAHLLQVLTPPPGQ